jgi:hypothetical protein
VKTVLLCRISGDVSDANIASSPALTEHEVSIAKNRKKKSTTAKIHPLTEVFGDLGHSHPEPMG